MEKPTVKYRPTPDDYIVVGHRALLCGGTVDHPRLANEGKWVNTSVVEFVGIEGYFETRNSYYFPKGKA